MSIDEDVKDELAKQKAQDKIAEARAALLAEQEAHRATMAKDAERSKSDLEVYMSELTKGEQRLVRMHAYLTFMTADWAEASSRQVGVDLIALRLARYMVTGEAA
jgi:hypothetical protein